MDQVTVGQAAEAAVTLITRGDSMKCWVGEYSDRGIDEERAAHTIAHVFAVAVTHPHLIHELREADMTASEHYASMSGKPGWWDGAKPFRDRYDAAVKAVETASV